MPSGLPGIQVSTSRPHGDIPSVSGPLPGLGHRVRAGCFRPDHPPWLGPPRCPRPLREQAGPAQVRPPGRCPGRPGRRAALGELRPDPAGAPPGMRTAQPADQRVHLGRHPGPDWYAAAPAEDHPANRSIRVLRTNAQGCPETTRRRAGRWIRTSSPECHQVSPTSRRWNVSSIAAVVRVSWALTSKCRRWLGRARPRRAGSQARRPRRAARVLVLWLLLASRV